MGVCFSPADLSDSEGTWTAGVLPAVQEEVCVCVLAGKCV